MSLLRLFGEAVLVVAVVAAAAHLAVAAVALIDWCDREIRRPR